jgi:hypothetical protein
LSIHPIDPTAAKRAQTAAKRKQRAAEIAAREAERRHQGEAAVAALRAAPQPMREPPASVPTRAHYYARPTGTALDRALLAGLVACRGGEAAITR